MKKTNVRYHLRKTKRKVVPVRRHTRKRKHRAVPLRKADTITLYHGTPKENVTKIKQEGLKATKPYLSTKTFDEDLLKEFKPRVSLTGRPSIALIQGEHKGGETEAIKKEMEFKKKYGEQIPKSKLKELKTEPAVFKVTLPREKLGSKLGFVKGVEKELLPLEGLDVLDRYEVHVYQDIPPKYIKEIPIKEAQKKAVRERIRSSKKSKEMSRILEELDKGLIPTKSDFVE